MKIKRSLSKFFCKKIIPVITVLSTVSVLASGNFIPKSVDAATNGSYIETRISRRNIYDGVYYIRNMYSGKYLEVPDHNVSNGTPIVQNPFDGDTNQQFQVTYRSDGYYTINPMHITAQTSAIDLGNTTKANTNGTRLQQWYQSSFYDEQKFIIDTAVYGGYQIGTKSSNGYKVFDVVDSSLQDNAPVQIWTYAETKMSDNWIFEEVNYGSAPNFNDIATSSSDRNCASFALRINTFVSCGMLNIMNRSTVEQAAAGTLSCIANNTTGRSIRRIPGANNNPTFEIADNEYRIALRVRYTPGCTGYDNKWDFHYMIQLNDGSWAQKMGGWGSSERLGYINPSTYAWPGAKGNYNSDTIYFACTY